MIAVDTNIVVRLLTQDDPIQYQKSLELFQNPEIFISHTVILETEWVLRLSQDCQQFYTFDEKFIKNARELTNCEVKKPDD